MKRFFIRYVPVSIQNFAISVYNSWLYRVRHSGHYKKYRSYFLKFEKADELTLKNERERRLLSFLNHVVTFSNHYKDVSFNRLQDFPVLEKRTLIENLNSLATISEKQGITSLTGGTTGASMKVIYTREDIQERNALLDHFRSKFGYKLGRKVGWFSGKDIVSSRDLRRGICYRDDWFNKIRFFSTFHINNKNFDSYWKALLDFSPEYLVGFPSSVYDLCVIAKERGLEFKGSIKVFFPTAETILPIHRTLIKEVLGCKLVDQYASSEGAPFILECEHGKLHIHPLSGIFEVIDDSGRPSNEGEILVTSFTTRGTPLVRYRIGDRIRLSSQEVICDCGSSFPLVDFIDGRQSDFIWSPENGRVNLGNLSNCTKNTKGIIQFQIHQKELSTVTVLIVRGSDYSLSSEEIFLDNLRSRLGEKVKVSVRYVESIPREKSGKFRVVKNELPKELMR